MKYVFLNAKGAKSSKIYSAKAVLSDCQPVYSNGYVYWYTTDNSSYQTTKPKLYAIKVSKPSAVLATSGLLTAPVMGSVSNAAKGELRMEREIRKKINFFIAGIALAFAVVFLSAAADSISTGNAFCITANAATKTPSKPVISQVKNKTSGVKVTLFYV